MEGEIAVDQAKPEVGQSGATSSGLLPVTAEDCEDGVVEMTQQDPLLPRDDDAHQSSVEEDDGAEVHVVSPKQEAKQEGGDDDVVGGEGRPAQPELDVVVVSEASEVRVVIQTDDSEESDTEERREELQDSEDDCGSCDDIVSPPAHLLDRMRLEAEYPGAVPPVVDPGAVDVVLEYKGRKTLYSSVGRLLAERATHGPVPVLPDLSRLEMDLCEDVLRHILTYLPPRDLFRLPHGAPRDLAALARAPYVVWKTHLSDLKGFYREVVAKVFGIGQYCGAELAEEHLGWSREPAMAGHHFRNAKPEADWARRNRCDRLTFPTFVSVDPQSIRILDEGQDVLEERPEDGIPDRIKWAALQYAPLRLRRALLAILARRQRRPFKWPREMSPSMIACSSYHHVCIVAVPVFALLMAFLSMCVIVVSEALESSAPKSLMIVATVLAALSLFACVLSIGTLSCCDEWLEGCRIARRTKRLNRLMSFVPPSLHEAPIGEYHSLKSALGMVRYNSNPWASFIPMTMFPFVACLAVPTIVVTICLAHWVGIYSLIFLYSMFCLATLYLVGFSLSNNMNQSVRAEGGEASVGRVFPLPMIFVVSPWWIFSVLAITLGVVRDVYLSESASEILDYVFGSLCVLPFVAVGVWLIVVIIGQVRGGWKWCLRKMSRLKEYMACNVTVYASLVNPFVYVWLFLPGSLYFFVRSYRWVALAVSLPVPLIGFIGWIVMYYFINSADYLNFAHI